MSVYLSCLSVLVCLSVCLCRLSDGLSGPSVGQAVLVPLQGQIRLARRQPEAVSWQVGFALLASVSVSQSCATPAPARPLHPLHVLFLSVMEFPSARAGSPARLRVCPSPAVCRSGCPLFSVQHGVLP